VDELPWRAAGWPERAEAWIGEQLGAHGLEPGGPVEEVKIRPWSAVLRAPARGGDVYFKANLPTLANEPELTRALHRICPEHVLDVLADDPGEGWMLQRDGGPALGSVLNGSDALPRLERMLGVYAAVQVDTVEHVDALIGAGAPDRRLSELRRLFERLAGGEHAELLDLAGRVGELAAELDAFGLPAAIDHSDLHAGNVLAPGGRLVIYDWHEAAVTHPFFSMVVAARSMEANHAVEPGGAAYRRLCDAYLEPWAGYGSSGELRAALDLALRLGPLTRALAWDRVLRGLPAGAAGEWAGSLRAWLDDLRAELERLHPGSDPERTA
jgi:hypothetical protein